MTTPRRSRTPSAARAAGLAALLATVVACAAPGHRGGAARPGIDPTFLPALETLSRAVEDHDDALAETILAGILAREPAGDTRALAEKFGRILTGRRLVAALDLSLVIEPVAERPGELRVLLVARHTDERDLVLRLAPASLRRVTTRVGATAELGLEESGAASTAVHVFDDLELPAGTTVVLELERFSAALGNAMAVREHVALGPHAGNVLADGEPYPAQDVEVPPVDTVLLAPWLPSAPVSPDELLSYVRRSTLTLPPLMERAVRIPPERRAETLDRLTAMLDELGDNRVHEIVPALRWLARTTEPGGSPIAWRRWLEHRQAVARAAPAERQPLDLPEPAPAR